MRQTDSPPPASQRAVVLCPRLPQQDAQNICLLIDITTLYANGSTIVPASPPGGVPGKRRTDVTVLRRWRFVSAMTVHSFENYMTGLEGDARPLRLPLPSAVTAATPLLRAGYVLLPTRWRDGSRGAALYRSPLSGAQPTDVSPPPAWQRPDPYAQTSADALVEFHELTGLYDVSYAAAWDLGRLLALTSGGVTAALAAYRRQARRTGVTAQVTQSASLLALVAAQAPAAATAPHVVRDFVNALVRLQGLPFRYLVPTDTMLPAESFRVFQVDPRWITCLVAGALSLCMAPGEAVDPALRPTDSAPICGALVRSNVLMDWPSLIIQGFAGAPAVLPPIDPTWVVPLSPGVTLVLFGQPVTQVDIHPHPEVLHHGLTPNFEVALRQLDGTLTTDVTSPVLASKSATTDPDRLQIASTQQALGIALGKIQHPPIPTVPTWWRDDSSAAFALQLVQTTPRGSVGIDWV